MSWYDSLYPALPTEPWAKQWVDVAADEEALRQLRESRWITSRVFGQQTSPITFTATSWTYYAGAPSAKVRVEQDRFALAYLDAQVYAGATATTEVGIEAVGQAAAPGQGAVSIVMQNYQGGTRHMVANGELGENWPQGEFIPFFYLGPNPAQEFRVVYRCPAGGTCRVDSALLAVVVL